MSTPTPAPPVVVISGRFVDNLGRPARGTLGVLLSSVITDEGDRRLVFPDEIVVDLDSEGRVVLSLPIPEDPDYVAAGLVYQFTETLTGYPIVSYFVSVNLTGGSESVDVADVSPSGRALGSVRTSNLTKYDASLLYATQATVNALYSSVANRVTEVEGDIAAYAGLPQLVDALDEDIDELDATKADLDYVNQELGRKASIQQVSDQLALRPTKQYVDDAVAPKADTVDVNSGLDNKLNKSEFYAFTGGSPTASDPAASREEIIVEAVTRSVNKVNAEVVPLTLVKARNTALAFNLMHMGA